MEIAPQPLQSLDIRIRLAHPSDMPAVVDFCRTTWEDQADYIHSVWDRWIDDDRGILIVATLGDLPVGLGRAVVLSDREGWLEGVRVDRRYRRQGIYRQLEAYLESHLWQQKLQIVRSCILTNNPVMTDIAIRRGYQVLTSYGFYSAPAISSPLQCLFPSTDLDIQQWSARHPSPPLYISRGAKWQELTPTHLQSLASRGRLWSFKPGDRLEGLFVQSEMEARENSLWVGLCDSWAAARTPLFVDLRRLSHRLGFPTISGFFPADTATRSQLLAAGYSGDMSYEYGLYERNLVNC